MSTEQQKQQDEAAKKELARIEAARAELANEKSLRIAVVNLVNAAGFDSEATTIIVGRNVDAALETTLGVLVQRRQGNLAEKTVRRYLLPWSNIRSVEYATPAVAKS